MTNVTGSGFAPPPAIRPNGEVWPLPKGRAEPVFAQTVQAVQPVQPVQAASPSLPPREAAGSPPDPQAVVPPIVPSLRVTMNDDAGRFVLEVVDRETGDIIRQVPTEEALRRITWLRQQLDAQLEKLKA